MPLADTIAAYSAATNADPTYAAGFYNLGTAFNTPRASGRPPLPLPWHTALR